MKNNYADIVLVIAFVIITATCISLLFINENLRDEIAELKKQKIENSQIEDLAVTSYCLGHSEGALAYQISNEMKDYQIFLQNYRRLEDADSIKYRNRIHLILK